MEAQKRMQSLTCLIVGMNGLGVEIAKNVILAGLHRVVVFDPKPCTLHDLSSQFYITEADISGKLSRAAASTPRLKELNSFVQVDAVPDDAKLTPELFQKYGISCIVVADAFAFPLRELCLVDEYCRSQKTPIPFILGECAGPYAFAFADFGPVHTSFDPDGMPTPQGLISMISQEEKTVLTLHDESVAGGMPFSQGDLITFTEVKGPKLLNSGVYRVGETTKVTFVIETGSDVDGWHPLDTRGLDPHVYGTGQVFARKRSAAFAFDSLSASLLRPYHQPQLGNLPPCLMPVDFRKFDRPEVLHYLVRGLYAFVEKYGALPRPGSAADGDKFVDLVKALNAASIERNAQLPSVWASVGKEHVLPNPAEALPLLRRLAMHAAGNLSPICAFLGGVLGQEVIKVTGKFTPLHQWLHFDIAEILHEPPLPEAEYAPLQSRYDGQIAVFGKTLQQKLAETRLFLVGTGALGCEFAKGFAAMGVGTDPKGQIFITDMDTIERSNLNRQFLFRPKDIGKYKAEATHRAMLEMNPDLKVVTYTSKVAPETENLFTDDRFWPSLTLVVNALDNIEARTYVDGKCAFHRKPLLESGTTGTMANVQVVLPRLTECYSDSTDFAANVGVPQCTIRNFPNQIVHCIEYSVAEDTPGSYNLLFRLVPQMVHDYCADPKGFMAALGKRTNTSEVHQTLELLHESLQGPATFEGCIAWARHKFQEFFYNQIAQLIHCYPADAIETTTGQPFWSASKRFPKALVFDADEPSHMQFIHCAANLRAANYGVPQHRIESLADLEYFKRVLATIKVTPFAPKGQVRNADPKKKDELNLFSPEEEERIIEELKRTLPPPCHDPAKVKGVKFEKDDDTNFHVDYCTAMTNLRAANYNIEPTDRLNVKTVAGRIIPALATTTAMVTGLVLNQLVQVLMGRTDISQFTNGSVNLGTHVWGFAEPLPPRTVETSQDWRTQVTLYKRMEADYAKQGIPFKWRCRAIPPGHTRHDYIILEGDVTLQDICDHMMRTYGLEVTMINLGSRIVYDPIDTKKSDGSKRVTQVHKEVGEKPIQGGKLCLSVMVQDPNKPDEIADEVIFVPEILVRGL